MQPQATLITLAAFIKRNAPGFRRASRQELLAFLGWYWRDGRVGIIRDKGRIVGAALARCMNHPGQAADPYYHDETGRLIWIQDIVSHHPLGIPLLLEHARQRFGPREAFAGRVFHRNGELRMLPFRVVERLSQNTGDSHHGFTFTSSATAAA